MIHQKIARCELLWRVHCLVEESAIVVKERVEFTVRIGYIDLPTRAVADIALAFSPNRCPAPDRLNHT